MAGNTIHFNMRAIQDENIVVIKIVHSIHTIMAGCAIKPEFFRMLLHKFKIMLLMTILTGNHIHFEKFLLMAAQTGHR